MRSASEGLQWSSEDILVLTKQPPECRCSGRAFPSLVGDIRDLSTPSNWTVIKERQEMKRLLLQHAAHTQLKNIYQHLTGW